MVGKVARKSDFSRRDPTPAESPIMALTRRAPASPWEGTGNGFRIDRVTLTMTCGYRRHASIPQAAQAGSMRRTSVPAGTSLPSSRSGCRQIT
jgi:hypothetical protein